MTTFVDNRDLLSKTSRYRGTRLIAKDNGTVVQETWERIEIPEMTDDIFHEVETGENNRPDLIALKFYGTTKLFWVIAQANKMIDPIAETTSGKLLRIPNEQFVFHNLLST